MLGRGSYEPRKPPKPNCASATPLNARSLSTRLAELASFAPAIVFLQECKPTRTLPMMGPFLTQRVNAQKGIALASLNADYRLAKLKPRANRGRAVMGATVSGPVAFTAL